MTMRVTRADRELREHLARLLEWEDAHANLEHVFRSLAGASRGLRAPGLPHTPWELLEHIRLTQRDILEFCTNGAYTEPRWPDDYWPDAPAPPSDDAWEASLSGVRADRERLRALALDPDTDLLAPIPGGDGQTVLRELLLVADHTAYHVGQAVHVRQALGEWPPV